LQGMANADVPFHRVAETLQVVRDRSRTSVFQAMFALQERSWHHVDDLCPKDGKLRFRVKRFDHNTSKFEVHLQLRHDGQGGLEGDFHIATDLFTQETGERIVQAYHKLMKCCVDSPEIPIVAHDITPNDDKKLVKSCNSTDICHKDTHILDMIKSHDRNSIAFLTDNGDPPITYGHFLETAQRVASYLRKSAGFTDKCRVGILMKSSTNAMAAIFGTLMAGCTNVIQDPEKTPVDRCGIIF